MKSDPATPAARLANALTKAGAPQEMIDRAATGDFTSPLAFPITQLVKDLKAAGLEKIARRAMQGEFDG